MTTIRVQCAVCATAAGIPVDALLLAPPGPHEPGPTNAVGRAEAPEPGADYIGYPDGSDGDAAVVMWLCHGCGQLVGMRLSANWVRVLSDAGVQPLDADYTDRRPEHPERPAGGAPFTPDDLLTLHEQLETDAWIAALTAGSGQP